MYRRRASGVEVLLIHPGGPFWANKDDGAWSIPKGGYDPPEEPLAAAQREFNEETGFVPRGPYRELGEIRQGAGKLVAAWAFEGDCDPEEMRSNLCEVEWPPRSGQRLQVPEADRAAWFTIAAARVQILKGQQPLLDALCQVLQLDGEGETAVSSDGPADDEPA
jgi:predicted NUDIX family NTP pyrophosphohydrolase